MSRWQAERWKVHVDKDVRELVAYSSGADKEYAEEGALRYAAELEKKGFTLGPGAPGEIKAEKAGEVFVICVRAFEG